MKKKFLRCFLISLFMAFAFLAVRPGIDAQAANRFVRVDYDGGITKAGGRYFEYKGNRLYYGNSRSNINIWIANSVYDVYTDGKTLYYIAHPYGKRVLTSCSISAGTWTSLKELPMGVRSYEDDSWNISTINGRNIYLTRSSFEKWRSWTYVYNTKTKKLRKIASKADIIARSGSYVYVQQDYTTDVRGYKISIFRLTSTGMKKVKTLGRYCASLTVIKGKIYYAKYRSADMNSGALYRCSARGSGTVKLGSFAAKGKLAQVMVSDITTKKCKISFSDTGNSYTYTFKTKSLKKN